jgi:hypothetical protein
MTNQVERNRDRIVDEPGGSVEQTFERHRSYCPDPLSSGLIEASGSLSASRWFANFAMHAAAADK